MLKAVIFDLDGVITDTAEFHYQAWKNMANSIDINFNYEFNEKLKGISRMDSLNAILMYGGVKNKYSDKEKIELAESKNEEYKDLLKNLQPADIYPGIKELLDRLKKENIKIGLASASKNGPNILESLQITEYFDVVIDPAMIGNGKPAPDIFLAAAEALEVLPDESIGIEDSEAGIVAIKEAEMFAVGVGTMQNMKNAGADLVLKNTQDMRFETILKAFNEIN